LEHLRALPNLTNLYITKTKVTGLPIQAFARDKPRCLITWNGGVIAPADADRVAAEYARAVGAVIAVRAADGGRREWPAAEELPRDKFALVAVHFGETARAADDGLSAFVGTTQLLELTMHSVSGVTDAPATRPLSNWCSPAPRPSPRSGCGTSPATPGCSSFGCTTARLPTSA
jgi:hypothetical protein